jgi:hypothetical protein
MEPIEAAVSGGEIGDTWFGRVTVQHCPICGRRVCEMLKGKGKLADAWPQKITCKNSHEFEVVPYRWGKE